MDKVGPVSALLFAEKICRSPYAAGDIFFYNQQECNQTGGQNGEENIQDTSGIGVARLGNSTTEHFIGPEAPGVPPIPDGDYHDEQGRIKRQGARFRVYEYAYNDAGRLDKISEVTNSDASITWSVHLANKKGVAPIFPPKVSAAPATVM